MKTLTTITAASLALALGACADNSSHTASASPASSDGASWVLTSAPEGAVGVLDAKSSAGEGDTVVLRGYIGGTTEPLSDESPVFRIVDTTLENICVSDDDHCATPWDYCCADPDELLMNTATVQIVDAQGNAIGEGPASQGVEPLDEVIVVGTVAPRPSDQVLTVRATGVYRVGG